MSDRNISLMVKFICTVIKQRRMNFNEISDGELSFLITSIDIDATRNAVMKSVCTLLQNDKNIAVKINKRDKTVFNDLSFLPDSIKSVAGGIMNAIANYIMNFMEDKYLNQVWKYLDVIIKPFV